MSRSPARLRSGTRCARSATFRTRKSRARRRCSWLVPQQADENILQRALRRVQIPKPDTGGLQRIEQRGDAGAFAPGVVGVDQLLAVGAERQMEGFKRRGDRVDGLVQLQRQLLAAELAHQFDLVLD